MRTAYMIALILTVIGGVNWGLVGFFDTDLVALLFGEMTSLSRIVYALVGVASVIVLAMSFAAGKMMPQMRDAY